MPLDEINVADSQLFVTDTHFPYLERLRREAPVHYQRQHPEGGPYWSVTRYDDIMFVDTNHEIFSSEPTVNLPDVRLGVDMEMFIAMDQPKHTEHRKTVQPAMSSASLAGLGELIRERAIKIFDELPRGEPFDWVDRVSIELTTQMLATLFDFPWEHRRQLTYWSDLATTDPSSPDWISIEHRDQRLQECAFYFMKLFRERAKAPPRGDLLSMLAHGEGTRNMSPIELLGNVILLIIGGNDTVRNSITGGLYGLNKFPEQYDKVLADPSLIPNMVSEIIRWQTPGSYMRRTATRDVEMQGQTIKKGDKVMMWYASGNRDETMFPDADRLDIERENARRHMSFGFGIHRCYGARLGEMQLRIVWEEIVKRIGRIEVLEEPERVASYFVRGYSKMMVRIPA
jgi:cytochrome P450